MFSVFRQRPLITLGVRELRVMRVMLAAMAVLEMLMGIVLIVLPGQPNTEGQVAIGLWFVLLGAAMGLLAWHGRWTPPSSEREKAREAVLVRRLHALFSGVELFLLSLALLGLLVPSAFGGLWEEHRSSVTLFLALAGFDMALRAWRRLRTTTTADASSHDRT